MRYKVRFCEIKFIFANKLYIPLINFQVFLSSSNSQIRLRLHTEKKIFEKFICGIYKVYFREIKFIFYEKTLYPTRGEIRLRLHTEKQHLKIYLLKVHFREIKC